jgi:ribosomal protein uL24
MKSDTERKRFYNAKLHQKTKRMHMHLSKELRAKLKRKRRAILARKGDKVRIMRGPGTGKTAKIARISHDSMKVYIEGVTINTAKGREVLRAVQPSNLMLVELEQTKERKELFSEAAFRKEEEKKPEKKPEAEGAGKAQEAKTEAMKPVTVEAEVVDVSPAKGAHGTTGAGKR